jgi:hypothetical protein
MCNSIKLSNPAVNSLLEAAKTAKAQGTDQLAAARAAAEKEGVCDADSEYFLQSLENDPNLLDNITQDKNEIILKELPGPRTIVASNINFVEAHESTHAPDTVKSTAPVKSNILYPENPKLIQTLKNYAKELDSVEGGRQNLIDKAKVKGLAEAKTDHEKENFPLYAQNRTKDFLNALDKAKEGKKLNQNDIQDIQRYIYFDTEHGKNLSKKGDSDSSIDGLFGPRTSTALQNVFGEIK